jgi:hypothetical protein
MNHLDHLHRRIEEYEIVITGHEDTAAKQIADIWSSTQPDIDAAREIIRHQEALVAQMEANREARERDLLLIASTVTAPTRSLLADARHQLAAISAPILRLPIECIAEIMKHFNVDNPVVVLQLVFKRWNTIAKATPQLWSKIALTGGPNSDQMLRLRGAHSCKSLEHLLFILSLSKDVPLDIELACFQFQPLQNISRFLTHQIPLIAQNLMIGPDLMASTSDNDWDWFDKAVRLLGADGRTRRWRSLSITSWPGTNEAPFTTINGPFDNLRSLYIRPYNSMATVAFRPLVTAIVQGAPCLSAVETKDVWILQRVQGWKDQRFWRKIESYHSLSPCDDWGFLSQATRLKVLSLVHWLSIHRGERVFLPQLHTLRLFQSLPETLDGFRLPALETLLLDGSNLTYLDNHESIPLLSVTSIIATDFSDTRILRRFCAPNLYHLHISSMDYFTRAKARQTTFSETFDGSQFMPRPISLHLNLAVSESQLLSALLQLPQIEELKIMPPFGSKFWTALTPRGASGKRKAKQYCPKLRIMVVEIKLYGRRQVLPRARTVELAIEMANAREEEGRELTHLLFSWEDGTKDEVLGSFGTLPLHPVPESFRNSQNPFW